jgi:hypothetical protein
MKVNKLASNHLAEGQRIVVFMELGKRSSSTVNDGLVVTKHAALVPVWHTKTM